jgi:twinkle protein
MSQLVAEALDQDATVMVYSGELPDFLFKRWLDLQLAGKANLDEMENEYGEPIYSIPENVQNDINEWYKGRAFIYDNNLVPEAKDEEETLLATIEKAIRNYGAKLIFIDNLMTAMECVDNQKDLYSAQSSFVWKLKRLAMRFNVHIMLVAHPRKTKHGEALNNDDISGSGDITNKVDLVFFYDKTADGDGKLTVTKNRLTGRLLTGQNAVVLAYSASCKRITSAVDSSKKSYGWENKTAPEGFEALQDDAECPF